MWASNSPPALIEAHRTSQRPMFFVFSLNKNSLDSFSATCTVPVYVGGIPHANFERKESYWHASLTRLRQMPLHLHLTVRALQLESKASKNIERKQLSFRLATSFPCSYTNKFILTGSYNLQGAVYLPPLPGTLPTHYSGHAHRCVDLTWIQTSYRLEYSWWRNSTPEQYYI